MVVAADPGEGFARGETVKDGQCCESGSGAADATAAGDFYALACVRAAVSLAEGIQGVVPVGGYPEVRPADLPVGPVRDRSVGQDQSEVGGAGWIAQGPTADSGSAGQRDQPRAVEPGGTGHVWSLPGVRMAGGILIGAMLAGKVPEMLLAHRAPAAG